MTIPIKSTVQELGSSREIALRRFYAQEKRFVRDKAYHEEYIDRMRENIQNGYMIEADEEPKPGEMVYYIPHHGVRTSKKFRIVFDASCQTNSGMSLNDALFNRNCREIYMRHACVLEGIKLRLVLT